MELYLTAAAAPRLMEDSGKTKWLCLFVARNKSHFDRGLIISRKCITIQWSEVQQSRLELLPPNYEGCRQPKEIADSNLL